MVVRRRKKAVKCRGYSTHGGGARKKRRGAGSHGGRGNAGTGKRAGHHQFGVTLGKHGFFHPKRHVKAVNVGKFTKEYIQKLVASGKITKEGDFFLINLRNLGYQKLLGTGTVQTKLKIIVDSYSPQAEEKVKAAQGTIVSTQQEEASNNSGN